MKDPTVYALPAQIASPSGQGGLSYSTYQKQLRLTRSITITKRIYQVERPLLFLLDLSQPVDWDRLGLYCNVSWERFSSSGKSGSPVFNYRKYLASQICLGSAKEELYSGFSLVSRCSSKSTQALWKSRVGTAAFQGAHFCSPPAGKPERETALGPQEEVWEPSGIFTVSWARLYLTAICTHLLLLLFVNRNVKIFSVEALVVFCKNVEKSVENLQSDGCLMKRK